MPGNVLHAETSPYLLQHRDNPVHWKPWGEEAFALARQENKPVLLSVGYAACHWCHVMAHESFEDPEIARLMNQLFINIKVDREERPDIDKIYMEALHRLGEQGGWPLTMFLTPEGEPFWGGTYFPPEPRYGRPGFQTVLREISRIYHEEHDKVRHNKDALVSALNESHTTPAVSATLTMPVVDEAARHILRLVDTGHGGLQGAPKFPQAPLFALLWRAFLRNRDPEFRAAVTMTLKHLCQGGIYDHLAGGFSRYSVDAYWLVPHFEKMLYDNAQLIDLLTLVWQETEEELFRVRIEETADWVLTEMMAESGAFAASLDADSEGEEGRFYIWTQEEICQVLPPDLAELFCAAYDVTPEGNWEGRTILNRLRSLDFLDEETEARLAEARALLLRHRARRPRPGWDDKVLADWNGLMIAALANAGAVFKRSDWISTAATAFDAVMANMLTDAGMMHSLRQGSARHHAMADDYANLIRAAIVLHEVTADHVYVDRALRLLSLLNARYWDDEAGGYFYTSSAAERLITRTKTAQDDATPNANATMLANLARLAMLTGDGDHLSRAQSIITAFSGDVLANIFAHTSFLNAFEDYAELLQAVIVGHPEAAGTDALRSAILAHSLPTRLLMSLAATDTLPADHPAYGKEAIDGGPTLYLCKGPRCTLPITTPEAVGDALAALAA